MQKRCQHCGRVYFARWRNEAVELCGACAPAALVCFACHQLIRAPADPAQLALFSLAVPYSRLPAVTLEERYWSLRHKASMATRRKYPYQ